MSNGSMAEWDDSWVATHGRGEIEWLRRLVDDSGVQKDADNHASQAISYIDRLLDRLTELRKAFDALTDRHVTQESQHKQLIDTLRRLARDFPWEMIHRMHEETHPDGIDSVFELAAYLGLEPSETRNDITYTLNVEITYSHGKVQVTLPRGATWNEIQTEAAEQLDSYISNGEPGLQRRTAAEFTRED